MQQFFEGPLIKSEKIEMRLYQTVLSGIAIQENSLIILPTGLGKTVIMVIVSAFFLSKSPNNKIVITAPTRPLIHQHVSMFQEFLEIPYWKIVELSGQTIRSKRVDLWNEASIIICTPQVFRNDIINDYIDLSKISLLCIDECHHMGGNDATVLATKLYRARNPEGRTLGITASPGTKDKVVEILEILGSLRLEFRDEDSHDVKQYLYNKKEEIIFLELPDNFKSVINLLENILTGLLQTLKELEIIDSASISKLRKTDLIKANKQLWDNAEEWENKITFFSASNAITNAIRVQQSLEMLETQGAPGLYNYLNRRKKEFEKTRKVGLRKFLELPNMQSVFDKIERMVEKGEIHPKLNVLEKVVLDTLQKEKSSKVLVFSNYRDTVKLIHNQLNKNEKISSQWFVGQNTVGIDIGLKQKEQVEILDSFKRGIFNVLTSTSVGEEGLDIAQCDLVIFYDIVPSSIRAIQRAGRTGRKREGKVIMLVAKKTRDEGYYYASKIKKKKLQNVLKTIQTELVKRKSKNSINKTIANENMQMSLDSVLQAQNEIIEPKKYAEITNINTRQEDEKSNLQQKKRSINLQNQQSKIESEHHSLPTLVVDHREKSNSLMTHLMQMNVKIRPEQLQIGDYIVSDRIAIERKSTKDFVASILNETLKSQLTQLKEAYKIPILILEGKGFHQSGMHPNSIRGMITSILLDFNIQIIFTKDEKDTAEYLIYLANREQFKKKRRVQKVKMKLSSLADEQIALVAQLPIINRKKARELLLEFKTPANIFNKSQIELIKVRGIGKISANRIDLILNTNFEED